MTFNILDHLETLTPARGQNRYYCPVCNGNDFTINPETRAYQCWHGCDVDEIREAIRPFSEIYQPSPPRQVKRSPKRRLKPAPIPVGRLSLLRQEPATDFPPIQSPPFIPNGVPSDAEGICYDYGEGRSSWRIQWTDPTNPKGKSKTFRQCSLNSDGAPQWTKGDKIWSAYRESEAIAAIQQDPDTIPVLLFLEGEGCVEIARSIGLISTTLCGGAWSKNEIIAFVSRIKNRNRNTILAMLPDHDTAGESKCKTVESACAEAKLPFLKLNPLSIYPDLPEKGDIAEILAVLSPEEFIERLEAEIHDAVARTEEFINEQPPPKKPSKPPSASAIAKEIAEDYRDRILWNDEHNTWMMYGLVSKGVWSAVSEIFVETSVNDIVSSRNINNYTPKYIKNIVGLLRYSLFARVWNERSSSDILPFSNGVLYLSTGEFSEHSPGNRLTWALPRPYSVVETDWSTISDWLDIATDNEESKHLLLCYAAAVLRGRSDLQKFLHLIGVGGTGKSTFTNLLAALIGEQNVVTLSLPDLEDKHALSDVFGKRLLLLPDQDKAVGRLGNFKRLTGQDPLNARRLYKNGFQFRFNGMAVVTSNFPIFHSDSGSWLTRRVQMIEFRHKPSEATIRDLESEFEPELPAFTNFLLSIPECVIERTLRGIGNIELSPVLWESKIRTDSIAAWLSEWVIADPDSKTRIGCDRDEWKDTAYQPAESTLFGSYNLFCRQSGLQPKSINNFSADLVELCSQTLKWDCTKTRDTNGHKCISGIRLRRESDTALTIEQHLDELTAKTAQTETETTLTIETEAEPESITVESEIGEPLALKLRAQSINNEDVDQELTESSSGEEVLMTTIAVNKENRLTIDEWCTLLVEVAEYEEADNSLLSEITAPMPDDIKRQVWGNLSQTVRDRLKLISKTTATPNTAEQNETATVESENNDTAILTSNTTEGSYRADSSTGTEVKAITRAFSVGGKRSYAVGNRIQWNNKSGVIRSFSSDGNRAFICIGVRPRTGGKKWETEEIIQSVPVFELQKVKLPSSESAPSEESEKINLVKQTTVLIKSIMSLEFDSSKLKDILLSRYGVNDRRQMNNQQLQDLVTVLKKMKSELEIL